MHYRGIDPRNRTASNLHDAAQYLASCAVPATRTPLFKKPIQKTQSTTRASLYLEFLSRTLPRSLSAFSPPSTLYPRCCVQGLAMSTFQVVLVPTICGGEWIILGCEKGRPFSGLEGVPRTACICQ